MLYFLYFRGGYAAIWNQKCWAFITIPVSMPPTRLESTEPLLVPISRRVSWRWRSFRFKNFLETQFTNHKQKNTHTDTHTHTDLPLKTNTHTHTHLFNGIYYVAANISYRPTFRKLFRPKIHKNRQRKTVNLHVVEPTLPYGIHETLQKSRLGGFGVAFGGAWVSKFFWILALSFRMCFCLILILVGRMSQRSQVVYLIPYINSTIHSGSENCGKVKVRLWDPKAWKWVGSLFHWLHIATKGQWVVLLIHLLKLTTRPRKKAGCEMIHSILWPWQFLVSELFIFGRFMY